MYFIRDPHVSFLSLQSVLIHPMWYMYHFKYLIMNILDKEKPKAGKFRLCRLKKYNRPIFAHSIGLNISIHRHYNRMTLDWFEIAFGIICKPVCHGSCLLYWDE